MASASFSGRPVFVTGASGFLGTHLVLALRASGAEVHALRRRTSSNTRLACDGVHWHEGDLLDIASMRQVVNEARPDVVFHLAAGGTTVEDDDVETVFRTNVTGTLNLWKALADNPSRIVYTGSCGEYGQVRGPIAETQLCEPTWFYPATKNASVVLLSSLSRESGRDVVILRPFGPYGPADNPSRIIPHVIRSFLAGGPVRVTAGEQLRDYSHVDDHVQALQLAATVELEVRGSIYNVGSGQAITIRYLVETIARAVSDDAIERVQFGAVPYRDTEIWEMYASIDAARRDLGYVPRVSLEDGIRRTVSWYREEGKGR
jgi:nucleoside-diphosphate-sugar epimerase